MKGSIIELVKCCGVVILGFLGECYVIITSVSTSSVTMWQAVV